MKLYTKISGLLLLCGVFSLTGCVEVLAPLLVKNPENERIKQESLKHNTAIEAIRDPAVTDYKTDRIVEIHGASAKHSKPTFISGVVAALYTREGQGMALLILTTIGGWAMAGIKWASNNNAGLALAKTIVGIQGVRKDNPLLSDIIKNKLASEHAKVGLSSYMKRKVAKTLGEA